MYILTKTMRQMQQRHFEGLFLLRHSVLLWAIFNIRSKMSRFMIFSMDLSIYILSVFMFPTYLMQSTILSMSFHITAANVSNETRMQIAL